MRKMCIVAALALLGAPGVVFGQEWIEYASREDRFTANFPGTPVITATTWKSEYGADLTGRVYTAQNAAGKYTMTVIDYAPVEQMLTARSKACPPGAETCRGVAATGLGYWKNDVRGAVVYGVWKLMERPGVTATHLMWNFMDLVAGQQVQLTNPDKSRTFASVYFHDNKLVIMEGTVPDGMPEPGLFQQSLGWLDAEGRGIRYQLVYYSDPDLPKPPIQGRPAPAADQGRISAPGAPQ